MKLGDIQFWIGSRNIWDKWIFIDLHIKFLTKIHKFHVSQKIWAFYVGFCNFEVLLYFYFIFLESSVKFQLEKEKKDKCFWILGPQNEYYYYEGDDQYEDVDYDNKKYKEMYNYEDSSESKELKTKTKNQRIK